jgi:hypothetical protein
MAMPTDVKRFRAVVACPGDVQREVDLLQGVIALVNRIFRFSDTNAVLELLHWRTDVYPGLHALGTQGQADHCLRFEDCDLVLAIFWKRFGTPVYDADSGTEHEVRRAVKLWKLNGSPQVMVFFRHTSDRPGAPEEASQWEKVRHFKDELISQQLVLEYEDEHDFQMLALSHIVQYGLRQLLSALRPRRSRGVVQQD